MPRRWARPGQGGSTATDCSRTSGAGSTATGRSSRRCRFLARPASSPPPPAQTGARKAHSGSGRQARQRARAGGPAVRRQLELSNEAAAALSGNGDAILRALEGHVECDVYLRGNLVTLEGDENSVDTAATVVTELADLSDQGHE